jgi:hypothetical protein
MRNSINQKEEQMGDIDLRKGDREFRVSTSKNGYMGPDILVTARDSEHAKQIVKEAGHKPNPHFPPEEIRRK